MNVHAAILRKQGYPSIAELRRLLEETTDTTDGSQARLAELLGCGTTTLRRWERGAQQPLPAHIERLRELEKVLRQRKQSINDELRAGQRPERRPDRPGQDPLPLCAQHVTAAVEDGQALLSFSVKIPGGERRTVVEVLVPLARLKLVLGTLSHEGASPESTLGVPYSDHKEVG